jgi:hypothetical protein
MVEQFFSLSELERKVDASGFELVFRVRVRFTSRRRRLCEFIR